MRKFGNQTVTFVKVSEVTATRNRYNEPSTTTTSTDVPGCLFRPLKFKEQPLLRVDKVTNRWRCTAPPADAVLNTTASDEVIVNGITYQMEGDVEVYYDLSGNPFKCSFICEQQVL